MLSESKRRRIAIGGRQGRSVLLLPSHDEVLVLNCDALCHMVHLVHADQARSKLKHVVSERDDNKLGVLGALLDVVCDNRHLMRVISCIFR